MKEKLSGGLATGRQVFGVCLLGVAVWMVTGCSRSPEEAAAPEPEVKTEALLLVQEVRDIMSVKDGELLKELFGELLPAGENPRIAGKNLDFKALGPRWSEGGPEQKFLPGLWFRQDIVVGSERYHVAFIQLQEIDPEDDKPVNAHVSSVAVVALTYKYRADTGVWEVFARQNKPFLEVGAWGEAFVAEDDTVAQVMLSPGTLALMTPSAYTGQGYSTYGMDILAFDGKSWASFGHVITGEDNSGACDARRDQLADDREFKPCWGYSGQVAVFPFVEKGYANILVRNEGTQTGPGGSVVPARDDVYFFDKGQYVTTGAAAN